jgi:hypothetical protein
MARRKNIFGIRQFIFAAIAAKSAARLRRTPPDLRCEIFSGEFSLKNGATEIPAADSWRDSPSFVAAALKEGWPCHP